MGEAVRARSSDQEDAYRAMFTDAVASGDLARVCAAARQLLENAQSLVRTSKFIRAQIEARPPAGLLPYRVALLSSFSIEFVEDPLWVRGLVEGLDVSISLSGFDLYQQDILNPDSALYREKPDAAVILAVDGPRWAPGLYEGFLGEGWRDGEAVVRAALDGIASLVGTFRQRSSAPILFHGLVPPRFPQLGVLDALETNSQAKLIADVNRGLAGLAADVPGFYPIDLDAIVRDVGYQQWYDPRLSFLARSLITRPAMDDLARVYMRYIRALTGRNRKCLVLDLDNTLWGGVLGLGVELGSEYPGSAFVAFQRAVLGLRERGVLLAVASKNNAADVDEVFDQNPAIVLKPEHFSRPCRFTGNRRACPWSGSPAT